MNRVIFLSMISFFFLGTVTSAMSLRVHTPISTSWSGDDSSYTFSSSGLSIRAIVGLVGFGGYVIAKCCEMFFLEMNEQSASNA